VVPEWNLISTPVEDRAVKGDKQGDEYNNGEINVRHDV
jgi:hypothetical protein